MDIQGSIIHNVWCRVCITMLREEAKMGTIELKQFKANKNAFVRAGIAKCV